MKRLALTSCLAIILSALAASGPAQSPPESAANAAAKPVLTPADYGQFERLSATVLSNDGQSLAYGIRRVDRTFELRLRDLAAAEESPIVEAFGESPAFSNDSRWFAWRVGISEEEREKLTNAKKPVRLDISLRELASGETRTFEEMRSFSFDETGRFLALLGYAPKEPAGAGANLTIVDLAAEEGGQTTLGNVADYSWSEVGSWLAMTLSTGNGIGNGVQAYDAASGRLHGLHSSKSRYLGLAWREESADLAVMRSLKPAKDEGEEYHVLAWPRLDGGEPRLVELSPEEAGVAEGLVVSQHGGARWSDDGKAIAIGLRPKEKADGEADASDDAEGDDEENEEDSAKSKKDDDEKPELPGLQIWHTSDVRIFPGQKAAESRDKRRTLLAVWHLEEDRVVQLGTELQEGTELAHGWSYGIERLSIPYPWGNMFGRPYHDVAMVNSGTGDRSMVLEKVRYTWLSAGGHYLLWFDGEHYWTHDARTNQKVNITEKLETEFADTHYDTPTDLLPPHGVGGWLEEDAAVFLYDRFDIWRVAPDGSGGERITSGAATAVEHRLIDLDFDEEAIDPQRPIYLSVRSERTEARGFSRVDPGAERSRLLVLDDKLMGGLTKAEDADVYLYRSESRTDSPDLFVAGPELDDPRQVTATNPFQDDYAWTRVELFDFKSESDRDLQAVLLYPVNHDPSRRYPMIVYTYEILAPGMHRYELPDERDYYNFTTWTQNGYFVLMPDIIYTAREPGVSAIHAVRPAVGKVVEMGLVDAKRVGLIGHSWGGYQATYLPTRIDTFAASVAGAPLTDFVSFMGQIHWNPGVAEVDHWETGQARMEVPYWDDPEAHHRNSPIHKVHEMETPLLMAFGDDDGVVDWDQGTEFYNFARRAGKQMVLLVYEGEDHGFRRKANQLDYHRRILEWFGHYLKGEPAPEWITQGIGLEDLDEEKERVAKLGAAEDEDDGKPK